MIFRCENCGRKAAKDGGCPINCALRPTTERQPRVATPYDRPTAEETHRLIQTMKDAKCTTCLDIGYYQNNEPGQPLWIKCGCKEPTSEAMQEMHRDELLSSIIWDMRQELNQAMKNWPAYNSAHEGLAVLQEEVHELAMHVYTKQKNRDLDAMKKEALQVAAVAIRFAAEVCTEERGRR